MSLKIIFNFILLAMFVLQPTLIHSQENGKIFYTKYQKKGNKEVTSTCILYFNKNQSYFLTKMEKAITKPFVDNDGSLIKPSNTIDSIANKPLFVYFNRKKNIFFMNNINQNQEILIYIKQDTGKWTLSKETKKIKNYNCFKATKIINGVKYIVWYTPKIKLPYGPIAINGLDGTILELYTEDNSLQFTFEKYESSDELINKFIRNYDFEKAISYEEYLELKKKRNKEFKERAILNAPAGSKIIKDKKKCDECN